MSEPRQPPVLDDLSALEQQVVRAALHGEPIGPRIRMSTAELAVTEDPAFLLRAEIVRELLLGRRAALDPRGVLVGGVRVMGRLDLDHTMVAVSITLIGCAIPEGLTCYNARLQRINLSESLIYGLYADSLHTDGGLILENATLYGEGEISALQLTGAHIAGDLNLDHATVINNEGPAIVAQRSRIERGLFMRDANILGSGDPGALRLTGTQIGGDFELDRITITNKHGPGISADSLQVGIRMQLPSATITGKSPQGAIRLVGARIGHLAAPSATVSNDAGPALAADHLQVDGGLFLVKTTLYGAGEIGTVSLPSANVGAQLIAQHATIKNKTGPAFKADGMRVTNGLFLQDTRMSGAGTLGTLRILAAQIGGGFELDRATLTNETGPAFCADGLHVEGRCFLRNVKMSGSGKLGAVRLIDAQIEGQTNLGESQIENSSGPSIILSATSVNGAFFPPSSILCPQVTLNVKEKSCPEGASQVLLQGFTYQRLANISWRQWLHLIVHHTPIYTAQPYQQLASAERTAGHDTNARQVLVTQQDDLRYRSSDSIGGRVAQLRHHLWGWLGRYGYRADRLVIALGIVLFVAGGLGYVAGQVPTRPGHRVAERVVPAASQASGPGVACSAAELIGLGIDRGLPVGATGLRARCDLDTATRKGSVFTYALWLLQALIWALATLAVASYTGLVRKPT